VAGEREDPKVAALQDARALNPHPEAVADPRFAESDFLDPRDLVQVKYEMVRRVRVDGDSVSASAAAFGFSRPSWYAAAAAVDEHGLPGLLPARPGPRRAHKLTDEVLVFLREELAADPSQRAAQLAARVTERFGVRVHPRSIERALARDDGRSGDAPSGDESRDGGSSGDGPKR
jgi:transposase